FFLLNSYFCSGVSNCTNENEHGHGATRGATHRQRAPGRRKILKVVKRSALRKARSVPSFNARRNSCCAIRHRAARVHSETNVKWPAREVFRSLDATPSPPQESTGSSKPMEDYIRQFTGSHQPGTAAR